MTSVPHLKNSPITAVRRSQIIKVQFDKAARPKKCSRGPTLRQHTVSHAEQVDLALYMVARKALLWFLSNTSSTATATPVSPCFVLYTRTTVRCALVVANYAGKERRHNQHP